MRCKPILDYLGLIEKIKDRGILVSDESKALKIFSQINYQRLMIYRKHFEIEGRILEGTTLEDIFRLYQFDRDLKHCLYPLIENFEFCFRAKMAYYLGQNTGNHGYLDSANFNNTVFHEKSIEKYRETYNREERKRHPMIMHHKDYYDDELPIYKAVELFTLGELTKLFENIRDIEVKKAILQDFRETERKLSPNIFGSWMKTVTDIRNICAHHDMLWKRKFVLRKIRKEYWDGLVDARGKYSLFTILVIFKILILDDIVFNESLNYLSSIYDKYNDIVCPSDLGFPDDWRQQLEKY
ncbi:MAG: Abi family protein [Saprospiraceae bacterium]|nr:Abi family protein [Saprospiraceae bacterium]